MCSMHFYLVELTFPQWKHQFIAVMHTVTDKTIEAAEALLHMESPTCLRDSRVWYVNGSFYIKDISFHVSRITKNF